MALLSDETKYNIKLVWFSVVQALYSFPPIQRILLIAGLLAIVPVYWIARVSANLYVTNTYEKVELVARPSFTNPQPLSLNQVRVIPMQDESYVGYVRVSNPNLHLAVYTASYQFIFKNAKGEQIYTTNGSLYLLPGESQYVLASRFTPSEPVVSGNIEITNIHWQKRFEIPTAKLSTPAALVLDAPDVNGIKVEGSVINESPYVLGSVRVTFLLKDGAGRVIGIVQRDEQTVRPKERRAFPQTWPGLSTSDVVSVEPLATTNTLDAKNLQVERTQTRPSEDNSNL